MELKLCLRLLPKPECRMPFNRTAYGIEIGLDMRDGFGRLAFNRTAYGIEMGISATTPTCYITF